MSPFSALGRRGLIQGSTATVLGSVAMPAGSRAEAAVPQPIATNLVTASHRPWNGRDCLALELTDEEQAGPSQQDAQRQRPELRHRASRLHRRRRSKPPSARN